MFRKHTFEQALSSISSSSDFSPHQNTKPSPDPGGEPPPPENLPSEIIDLAPTGIRTTFGTETFLDVGSDATVKLGTSPLKKLQIFLPGELNDYEHLGLRQNSHVSASDDLNPGSVITVDGVAIATIPRAVDQWALAFNFNEDATPERVQELIHCLTYTNTSDNHFIYSNYLEVVLVDANAKETSTSFDVIVAPEDAKVLTAGTDHFTGAAGDDTFYAVSQSFSTGDIIVGGEGSDTLQLSNGGMFDLTPVTSIIGIEKIQGTDAEESLTISVGQLAAIKTLDGGGSDPKHGTDFLQIKGDYIDLTTADIVNFEEINLITEGATVVVDNVDMAKLIWGRTYQGETLILTQGTLTDEERLTLHRQGIDTVTTLADNITTKHEAPKVRNLDGDHVTMNSASVYIDADKNVKIDSDDGLMRWLEIAVEGSTDRVDVLEVDTTGSIKLSNGLKAGSKVTIDDVEIGAIEENYTLDQPGYLSFEFNENATPALVEELLQAITYRNTNGKIDEAKQISVTVYDIGYRPSKTQTVSIDPEDNAAPDDIKLSAQSVAELSAKDTVIGTLSAHDTNFGETFTYTLKDNAGGRFDIVDGKLVVKQGVKLDYEQAKSHTVKIMVEDTRGLTFEKSFTIQVTDINPETTTGSSGHDKIVGGAGRDKLSGGAGADTLSGGRGDDVLTGGAGRDSLTGGDGRDTFSFQAGDTGTGAARDTIVDFRHGVDRIDLAKIDANTTTRADNRFTELLGASGTFTKAGQLRYDAATGILSGNTDRDAQAEFQIYLKNKPAALTLSDFIL